MIYRQPFCQGVKKSSLQLVAQLVEIFSEAESLLEGSFKDFQSCEATLFVQIELGECTSNQIYCRVINSIDSNYCKNGKPWLVLLNVTHYCWQVFKVHLKPQIFFITPSSHWNCTVFLLPINQLIILPRSICLLGMSLMADKPGKIVQGVYQRLYEFYFIAVCMTIL